MSPGGRPGEGPVAIVRVLLPQLDAAGDPQILLGSGVLVVAASCQPLWNLFDFNACYCFDAFADERRTRKSVEADIMTSSCPVKEIL
jgi:hypothetical protein